MIYRVLGGIALALGAIFGIITLLVFLPFLSNYNISLLVLTAVFGIIAYVLLAIGWQLLHPPAPRGEPVHQDRPEKSVASEGEGAEEQHLQARPQAPAEKEFQPYPPSAEPVHDIEEPEVAVAESVAATEAEMSIHRLVEATAPSGPERPSREAPLIEEVEPPDEEVGSPIDAGEREKRDSARPLRPRSGFAGFDEEAADQPPAHSNGESGRGERPHFKKPGAPVPHHESRR